nr:hypothetical protein [Chloroflexota bacterium]
VMRRLIRAAYLGLDAGDVSALDDPSTIEAIGTLGRQADQGSAGAVTSRGG